MNKVTRQCPHTTTFEEKGEPNRNRTEVLLLTSLTPFRQVKPAHNIHRKAFSLLGTREMCGGQEVCVCVEGGGGDYLYPPTPIAACLLPADRSVSSSSMLLCVHRDPTVYQGRVTQDVHLDFNTALSSNPCQSSFPVCMRYAHSRQRLLAGSRRKRRRGALTVKSVSVSPSEP